MPAPPKESLDMGPVHTQAKCPKGHMLPHKTNAGQCTPVYCAGKIRSKKEREEGAKETGKALVRRERLQSVSEVDSELEDRLALRIQALEKKRKYFKVPQGLTGADAEEWIDRRLVELGVDAVAELEEQLKVGTAEERARAAFRVLDSIGRGKRDIQANTGPVIMLVTNGAEVKVPWAQEQPKVVKGEARVVETPKPEAPKDGT